MIRSVWTSTTKVAVAAVMLAAGPQAFAASNPLSADFRVNCLSQTCAALPATFGGRIDWYSGNIQLFSELGNFTHSSTGDIGATLSGNHNSVTFASTYQNPLTTIFAAPDLNIKVYDTDGGDVLLLAQTYLPQSNALWSQHSEDATAENTRALAAEDALNTQLNVEISKRSLGDKNFQAQLDAETAARKAADITLQNNLDIETNRAKAAELVLTNNLNSEINRATTAENTETARAKAAELVLTNNLNSEIARAIGSETAELNRATSAETVLTNHLNQEIARATAAENNNVTTSEAYTDASVAAEAAIRISGDAATIATAQAYTINRYSNKFCPNGQDMYGIDGNGNPLCDHGPIQGRLKTFAQNGTSTCSFSAMCSQPFPACSCSCSGGWWASGSCSCSCTSTATASCSANSCTAAAVAVTCPDVGGVQGMSQLTWCQQGAWDNANGCTGVSQTAMGGAVTCSNTQSASCSCSCGLGWWGGSCSCSCQPGGAATCDGGNGQASVVTSTAICAQAN